MRPLTTITVSVLVYTVILLSGIGAQARTVSVRGYFRKNGTYVAPHYRTSPNSTKLDNWSTKGNVNPYTGKAGTKDPYPETGTSSSYASDKAASTGMVEKSDSATGSNFERASLDCDYAKGTTGEAFCIKERMENIKKVEKLKKNSNFDQASIDCAYAKGSLNEAFCIKERMENINKIEKLKKMPDYGQAAADCQYSQGSLNEAFCIKERIENIKKVQKLKTNPDYEQASIDCEYSKGSLNEAFCIKERLKNIAEIRQLSSK